MNEAVLNKLERRLGRLHAKLRLGIETDHEAQIFGQGINFFHIEIDSRRAARHHQALIDDILNTPPSGRKR